VTDGKGETINTHAATISTQTDKERLYAVMMYHNLQHHMSHPLLAEFLNTFMLVLVAASARVMETTIKFELKTTHYCLISSDFSASSGPFVNICRVHCYSMQ
jgi:glycerol uptake facilitator-like aquaporin